MMIAPNAEMNSGLSNMSAGGPSADSGWCANYLASTMALTSIIHWQSEARQAY